MSVTRRPSVHRAANRSRRAPRLHVLELEGRLAPAVFNIPNGDVAAFVAAINTCNTNNEADTINLAANGTYTFTAPSDIDNVWGNSALPRILLDNGNADNSVTIQGHGASVQGTLNSAAPMFRFLRVGGLVNFPVPASDVSLFDLTIRGFRLGGGALHIHFADVRLTNCVIANNTAFGTSAIFAGGLHTHSLTLDRCKIVDNTCLSDFSQAIELENIELTATGCLIANNAGSRHKGIYGNLPSRVTLTDTVVRDHPGRGIDLNAGSLDFRNGTVSGNDGGGISCNQGPITLSDSTISNNGSSGHGGGVHAGHGLVATNCTIVNNQSVQGAGVWVWIQPDFVTRITNCTITGNVARKSSTILALYGGGGLLVPPTAQAPNTIFLRNTVIAGNTIEGDRTGPDIYGAVVSEGYNFIGTGAGATITGGVGDRIGTAAGPLDPRLGPLQDNGGPTLTRLPLPGSPLINAADPSSVPTPSDQRGPGFPRRVAGRVDIGAVEAPFTDLSLTISDGRAILPAGATTTYTVVVRNIGAIAAPAAAFSLPQPPIAAAMTWTSAASGGASGNSPSGSGPISDVLTLPVGASVTYLVTLTLAPAASGPLRLAGQVTWAAATDLNPADNAAVDVDGVLVGGRLLAVTPDAGGGPVVRLVGGRDGAPLYDFTAYDPTFLGGVRVAVADFTADGIPDVVTIPGAGGGPHVKVFDGATGGILREFNAYDPAFRGGGYVAAADVTGDGTPDVVTGAGPGGGPHVKVFDGATGVFVRDWMAYDAAFRGGVSVAAGDVDGDNRADVVTGAGPGGGPHVKVFGGATGALLAQAFAYEADFRGGVWVAAGDVDGDGRAEVITSPNDGGGPFVKVLRGSDLSLLRGFLAYDAAFRGGARVAAVDATGDGRADIATAAGPGGGPHVRLFDGTTGLEIYGLMTFDPAVRGGIFVGAG